MFYTIQNNGIITADNKEALTRFYDNVLPLPQDYEVGKYNIFRAVLYGAVRVYVNLPRRTRNH